MLVFPLESLNALAPQYLDGKDHIKAYIAAIQSRFVLSFLAAQSRVILNT